MLDGMPQAGQAAARKPEGSPMSRPPQRNREAVTCELEVPQDERDPKYPQAGRDLSIWWCEKTEGTAMLGAMSPDPISGQPRQQPTRASSVWAANTRPVLGSPPLTRPSNGGQPGPLVGKPTRHQRLLKQLNMPIRRLTH
jgi:hypothetical protein